MLNIFAATGHMYYAKSAPYYFQQMVELEIGSPCVYRNFIENRYHNIQRTNTFWEGPWSDLIIE